MTNNNESIMEIYRLAINLERELQEAGLREYGINLSIETNEYDEPIIYFGDIFSYQEVYLNPLTLDMETKLKTRLYKYLKSLDYDDIFVFEKVLNEFVELVQRKYEIKSRLYPEVQKALLELKVETYLYEQLKDFTPTAYHLEQSTFELPSEDLRIKISYLNENDKKRINSFDARKGERHWDITVIYKETEEKLLPNGLYEFDIIAHLKARELSEIFNKSTSYGRWTDISTLQNVYFFSRQVYNFANSKQIKDLYTSLSKSFSDEKILTLLRSGIEYKTNISYNNLTITMDYLKTELGCFVVTPIEKEILLDISIEDLKKKCLAEFKKYSEGIRQ